MICFYTIFLKFHKQKCSKFLKIPRLLKVLQPDMFTKILISKDSSSQNTEILFFSKKSLLFFSLLMITSHFAVRENDWLLVSVVKKKSQLRLLPKQQQQNQNNFSKKEEIYSRTFFFPLLMACSKRKNEKNFLFPPTSTNTEPRKNEKFELNTNNPKWRLERHRGKKLKEVCSYIQL